MLTTLKILVTRLNKQGKSGSKVFLATTQILHKELLKTCELCMPTVILNWFSLLQDIKKKVDILSPCQIWLGDKTRVQNVPKEIKVLGVKKSVHFKK